jgi:hypothetical protein
MLNFRIFRPTLATIAAAMFFPALATARDSYSHVTVIEGAASLLSEENGRNSVVMNLPILERDELTTEAGSRAEVELADGSRIQIAGESRVRFDLLAGQDGKSAEESAVTLLDGSIAAESRLIDSTRALRIDTADTSIYVSYRGQLRVNRDSSGATSVVVRQGSAEVHTPSGTETVEAGHYILSSEDEPPEVARGAFSRDRFDVWVSDRTGTLLHAYNSVSARYVDGDDYDEDVAVLDDYGEWDYSSTCQSEVWRPSVSAGWSPYSSGYWYYTPAGASWVCDEPWGWFPHHYGNWFFDVAFNSWCWSPASVFSPAWVYWSYSGSHVGWCPIGSYAYYAPYRSYWRRNSWGSGLSVAINGVFDPRRVDFGHGWNFVGVSRFGTRFNRGDIATGRSIAGRLGTSVAITSAPLRVAAGVRNGAIAQQLQAFARSAPQMIARTSRSEENSAIVPFLGRQETLPAATLRALESNRIARIETASRTFQGNGSPAPSGFAPRGGILRRGGSGGGFDAAGAAPPRVFEERRARRSDDSGGRAAGTTLTPPRSQADSWRNRSGEQPARDVRNRFRDNERAPVSRQEPAPRRDESWRRRRMEDTRSSDRSQAFVPRENARALPPLQPPGTAAQEWRQRSFEAPARRIIDGIDRGRASGSAREERFARPSDRTLPRSDWRPETAPVPRRESRFAPPPGPEFRTAPPSREQAWPAPRPEFHAAPPSREATRPAPPAPNAARHPDRDKNR